MVVAVKRDDVRSIAKMLLGTSLARDCPKQILVKSIDCVVVFTNENEEETSSDEWTGGSMEKHKEAKWMVWWMYKKNRCRLDDR